MNKDIRTIVEQYYTLSPVTIQQFDGEINLNFKTSLADNQAYNLKLFPPSTDPNFIDFLVKIHLHCESIQFIKTPKIIRASSSYIQKVNYKDESYYAILLEWIDGKLLSELHYHPTSLLHSWGTISSQLQLALSNFNHPYLLRTDKWNPIQLQEHQEKIKHLRTSHEILIIENILTVFFSSQHHFTNLPKSNNHSDLHLENLIISFIENEPKITGLIDFGDSIYTARICDLAIACAYAMMEKLDPILAACKLIKGYSNKTHLTDKEIALLDILIKSRLAISVLVSAEKRSNGVTDPYQYISENKAWDVLNKLHILHPNAILYKFRNAAGLTPHPNQLMFEEWCNSNNSSFSDIINFQDRRIGHIDLSIYSSVIPSTDELHKIHEFEKRVFTFMEEKSIDVAYGGYGEIRPFYTTDNYEIENDEGYQWRTQHIGLDLWTKTTDVQGNRTEIYTPVNGEVVVSFNNDIPCDYGNTIIIKHKTKDFIFYTLYGHLSNDSLQISPVGKKVHSGELIAYLGEKQENGSWPPHLHFQIVLDLMGNETNFPGVAFSWEIDTWKSICPDPSLLCSKLRTYTNTSYETEYLLKERSKRIGKNLSVSYKQPLTMVRGHMQYLYDGSGRRYLDTVNNVAHVGHEHPYVTKEAINQFLLLNTNSRYLHPEILKYSRRLLSKFPSHLTRVFFTNSGSEANELALRIAYSKTKTNKRMVFKMGYHGNTANTVSISSYKFDRKGGEGHPENTQVIPYFEKGSTESKTEYLRRIETLLDGKPVTFIGENILSCAGQIELDSEVLKRMYYNIQKLGGVCIADEVQTGFGRVGEYFWSFQLHGVKPDIVTMGKPIGNGHPIGAVVCTEELAESFNNGMEYFNTFGGNPVSMKIANAVLDVIENEGLQQHAKEMESLFYKLSAKLSLPGKIEKKIRGKGLFLGIEMKVGGKGATKFVSYIVNRMRQRGFLMSSDGPEENVLKIKPPMQFSKKDMIKLFNNIQKVIDEYSTLNSF